MLENFAASLSNAGTHTLERFKCSTCSLIAERGREEERGGGGGGGESELT